MNKVLLSIIGLLLLSTSLVLAEDTDVSGEWLVTMQTPRGDTTRLYTFEQDGEELKITTENMHGEQESCTGTITGDEITWTQVLPWGDERAEISVTFSGMVFGDAMTGQIEYEGGTLEWSAIRKP